MRLDELGTAGARARLGASDGLPLRTGPFVTRIRTRLPDVARSVLDLYGHYEVASEGDFCDFHVCIRRPPGLRSLWRPQVEFAFEGQEPFNPLPGDQGFPLLEWGLNWCVYSNCHQYLIIHAAVLERAGGALLLPAPSGSGKSTLCAALALSGWRLLSDELALIAPREGWVLPNPRPVSLKNASIDVIQRFAPRLRLGSKVAETAKGVVAHFAAPPEAVDAASRPAPPRWIVLPRYVAGSPALLQPIDRAEALIALAENAFNYDVFGGAGFDLVASIVDRVEAYTFEYSRIEDALEVFGRLAAGNWHPGR